MSYKTYLNFILILLFLICAWYATGYAFEAVESDLYRDFIISVLGSLCVLILLSLISTRLANTVLLIYIITTVLYFPVGWLYGAPTFQVIGAAMETDAQETLEFFGFLPKYLWFMQIAYAILSIFVWRIRHKIWHTVKIWQKKIYYYIAAFLSICFIAPPLAWHLTGGEFQNNDNYIPVTLVGFYADLVSAPTIYLNKKQVILKQSTQDSTWKITSIEPKYKNHVLVIGESARSDYMNVYGFPLKNTPFFSHTNGTFIDGYISTAEFTMSSLPQTLSLKNQNYNNVISLAKQAGFKTAWLSNQGMLGLFSDEISSYALRADYSFFTQRGEYQKSIGMNDKMLLPQLEKVLSEPTDKPRLIVLHLMGSHHDFCKRLEKSPEFEYKSKKLSCYVSTIKQTDELLHNAIQILQRKNEPYSLIYFSDHGLKHEAANTKNATLIHGGDTYQSFTVPLARLSSDDTERKMIKTQRSAFNFLNGFSQWTGIHTQELTLENDFFGQEADKEDETNNLRHVNALKKDPVTY